ncbi:MAG: CRISPR-associated endonuclease Cas2 [Paludibacteraceae bacterium]
MPRKQKKTITFVERMQKFCHAGIATSPSPNRYPRNLAEMPSIEQRVAAVLGLLQRSHRPATNMLFFVMYDIESDKVRTQVVKYLQRKGCMRIQRSIFLADLPPATYDSIRNDLAVVQAAYDNNDSILVVPISTDYLRSMKIIGQNINLDLMLHNRNTLIF